MLDFSSTVAYVKLTKQGDGERLEAVLILQKGAIEGPVLSQEPLLPVPLLSLVGSGRSFLGSWGAGAAWGGCMSGCVEG